MRQIQIFKNWLFIGHSTQNSYFPFLHILGYFQTLSVYYILYITS